jgi:DnaJ family protein C protein 28
MRQGNESPVEQQIREAIERGDFDDLPGKGKPIDFGLANPYEDSTAGVLRRILRDNECSHPMIEAVRALDAQLGAMRNRLRAARETYIRTGSERAWNDAVEWFRREAAEWNALVLLHNLKAPAATFQRLKIDSDGEIHRVIEAAAAAEVEPDSGH